MKRYSFIHMCILNTYYALGIVVSIGNTKMGKTGTILKKFSLVDKIVQEKSKMEP